MPILVFSMFDESIYADRALNAGANGYLIKSESPSQIIEAVRSVLKNKMFLSANAQARIARIFFENGKHGGLELGEIFNTLTDRELEILSMIGQGKTTASIAKMLNLSVSTVETHRAHIKEKLNLKNSTELVRYAVQWTSQHCS